MQEKNVAGDVLGKGTINTVKALGALRSMKSYNLVVEDLERRGSIPIDVDIVAVDQKNGSKQLSFLHGERPFTVVTLGETFYLKFELFADQSSEESLNN